MILDNRQVVPDIIVSRDGVPNYSSAYNINTNFNNNVGQPDRVGPESPRHFSKGRPHEAPRHAYATGNNNGSPRHAPHNGNYYSEPKAPPLPSVYQRAEKVINNRGSSLQGKTIIKKSIKDNNYSSINDDDNNLRLKYFVEVLGDKSPRSPRHYGISPYGSPVHTRYDLQSASRDLLQNLDKVQSKLDSPGRRYGPRYSPVHQVHRTQNVKQGIFCSPKHLQRNSNLFSPRRVYPSPPQRQATETTPKNGRLPPFQSEAFRPRSSSHPCESTQFQAFSQSKIPVHIVRPRTRQNSGEQEDRIYTRAHDNKNVFSSPCKNLNQKHKILNTNTLIRKDSAPEFLDYKKGHNFMACSPKRVNLRNQNVVRTPTPQLDMQQQKSPRRSSNDPRGWNANKRESLESKQWNGDNWRWNKEENEFLTMDTSNNSWNIETEMSQEENTSSSLQDLNASGGDKEFNKNRIRNRLVSWPSSGNVKKSYSDCEDDAAGIAEGEEENEILSDRDSGVEADGSLGSRMVLIKCKDASYLTRIIVSNEGVHGLKVVGRVGVGGAAQGHVMSLDQPAVAPSDLNSNHSVSGSDDVGRGCDVTSREVSSDNAGSLISQATDTEFEHEAADYQWLLDYEYRESYSRESLGGGRDGSSRVSVLQQGNDESHISYETLSRNIDANLAEIDMDTFRSEDIHQLLSLPNICGDLQDGGEDDVYCSVSGSLIDQNCYSHASPQQQYSTRCAHHHQQLRLHQQQLQKEYQQQQQRLQKGEPEEGENFGDERPPPSHFEGDEREEELEEEYSGVSGDVSLYQSGPLFSPLKEPPQIPPSFSVDSLDSDSIHEDLILTCQANKNNYTIAFEGSFVQYSEDSDFQEPALSDGTGSGAWSTERLEGRSPAPNMTYSDQPYTTWSRVSRRSSQSRTPDPTQIQASRQRGQSPLPLLDKQPQPQQQQQQNQPLQHHQLRPRIKSSPHQQESKSNSMPNLMRRSLMRRSLETSGNCMKVYDLQNSLRSSHFSSTRSVDANNFSLMRLFMKQKSLSKEAVSLSSSCTDPSQEGVCSSSENHSAVNDSSDWPMNSQSENDMDGSASPVPATVLSNQLIHERLYRGRGSGSPNIMATANQDNLTNPTDLSNSHGNVSYEGMLNNNNLTHLVDNANTNPIDNITSFEDSLKETNPCSKPPMTSPIREEPEGMDISIDSRCENKVLSDQSEKESKPHEVLRLKDSNISNVDQNKASLKTRAKDIGNRNIQSNKNTLNADDKKRPESPGTPKHHHIIKKENLNSSQRKRQDSSGNSSSGYISNKGSTEKIIRRSSDSEKIMNMLDRPKPKPRSLKQVTDQCLQTSNHLKVSATVNTSGIVDKKEVYVYYPNYALPDLGFLKEKKYSVDARIFLVPQHYMLHNNDPKAFRESRTKRPFSCGDMEKLRRHGFSHVKDWESLNFLLPKELKEMLLDDTECMETIKPSFCKPNKTLRRPVSCDYAHQKIPPQDNIKEYKGSSSSLNSTQPSSGYRGSSTMLNDSDGDGNTTTQGDPRYIYRYDSASIDSDVAGPPLPKRSISLTTEENPINDGTPLGANEVPPRPPLPRGILRKCSSLRDDPHRQGGPKRYSSGDAGSSSKGSSREDLLKRRSLQEPIETEDTVAECVAKEDEEVDRDKNAAMGCSCMSECTGFCAKGLRKKNLLLVNELPEVSSHEEFTDADLVRLRSQVSEFLAAKGSEVGAILTNDTSAAGSACDCPRKSVSFAKTCAHRQQALNQSPVNLPQRRKTRTPDEDLPPMLYDAHDKKTLVLSVRNAVEKLVLHFNRGTSQQEKNKLGTSLQTPEVAQLALEKLCPAIYALLSDGLLPSLHSLFGKISNSVWRVVEATSQMGPSTKALNDLVLTLNSEECLSEGPIKFNAFIFGLLNIRSLDAWLGYLRTRESALQKHYHPESFLYLSNTAMRGLYDDLLIALRPLALLPFRLDLLHEYKALHASLLKMEERLALHTSQSPTGETSLDLLLAAKESKEFRNAAARTTDRNCRSPRPRSCHENAVVGGIEDVHGALRKRWSGVQLGSRLVTAIDKLLTEEGGAGVSSSSGDYSDSLNPPRKGGTNHRRHDDTSDDAMTDLRASDLSSRDEDVSERSATDKDTDTEKGLRLDGRGTGAHGEHNESEGEKFRRLQLKWEAMTGQNPSSAATKAPTGVLSPGEGDERDNERTESLTSPAGVQRSRIPRPVSITSPQQAFKPFESSREKTSPQIKQGRRLSSSSKDHPKPAPRRSLKDRVLPTEHHHHYDQANAAAAATRGPASSSSVRARVGSRAQASPGCSNANTSNATVTSIPGSNRASSVPGRKAERGSSGTRYESQLRGTATPRSASQGRRRGHAEETRLVQTLHHRLATDNGHLSFSRGDILTVIVDVDERFLLCCLHDRKGLVPRSSVVAYNQ